MDSVVGQTQHQLGHRSGSEYAQRLLIFKFLWEKWLILPFLSVEGGLTVSS